MVMFRYCSLGGDTAMPGGLHAKLCHAFLAAITILKNIYMQLESLWFIVLNIKRCMEKYNFSFRRNESHGRLNVRNNSHRVA